MHPTLEALRRRGIPARVPDILTDLIEQIPLGETAVQAETPGGHSRLTTNASWARTGLKCLGLAEQTGGKQSAWALTPLGRAETRSPRELAEAAKKAIKEQGPRKIGGKAEGAVPEDEPESSERAEQDHWRDELLRALLAMSPGAFENLCKRLLYATGIEDVVVKGGSGDKGIDGEGWLRTGLVRTKVVFQAKRWEGSVTPNIVREMRGSMPADAGHGIILTTARFTKGAKDDACSPQGATINLVDGAHLCELLLEHEIGVKTVTRQVVDHAALNEF